MSDSKSFHSSGNQDGTPPPPLDSSTVILTRESRKGPFQVFLMRRRKSQRFMGGAYVFPGGKLEPADCDPALETRVRALTTSGAQKLLQEPRLPGKTALGLFFAAVRETFEESGVLLACDENGDMLSFGEGETAGRFAGYRLQLYRQELSLQELAEKENLLYTLDRLIPYARWITPEIESRRFNTRFFLSRHPREQAPFHANIEMTESLWTTPEQALRDNEEGRILLMPPTLKTLEELNGFASIDELFAHTEARSIVPILPEAFQFEGGFGVKLPHDPEYTLSEYKRAPRPGETSRVVHRDGRWHADSVDDPQNEE